MPKDMNSDEWKKYYQNVKADFYELKEQYPWATLTILPTVMPEVATIRVVAANKDLIEAIGGVESDFTDEYSRILYLTVPIDYRSSGCEVFGAGWVDTTKFENKDIHFFHRDNKLIRTEHGLKICVGTPESFEYMPNVILENVRTAENMLIAYERVMTGVSSKLELIAYAHGDQGRKQFEKNRKKYIPKG